MKETNMPAVSLFWDTTIVNVRNAKIKMTIVCADPSAI